MYRAVRPRTVPPALPLLLAAALGGCYGGGERGHHGRGVLVLALDCLRADHTTLGGYDRDTTPQLAALAKDGVYFSQTFSAAPALIPAHAALLTGCDPAIARRPPLPENAFLGLSREWHIPAGVPSLAREYLVAGFATAAFVDHPWLVPELGFDAGFEDFYAFREDVVPGMKDYGIEGSAVRFLRWLGDLDEDRDWFAYLTVNELAGHGVYAGDDPIWATYFAPREELPQVPPVSEATRVYFAVPRILWPGGSISVGEYEARYDGAVRRLDGLVHRLLGQLRAMGRYDETTICVVGTFGTGFGESGIYLDTGTLSDVDLHVPWILRPPSSFHGARGIRSAALASTIDVAPTLFELSGIPRPPGMHGVSQMAASSGTGAAPRLLAFAQGGLQDGFAVRSDRFSYEFVSPGAGGPPTLASSWFGGPRPRSELWREHLRDRASGAGPGDLAPSADFPDEAARLRSAGEQWYRWMELARDALQTAPWGDQSVGASAMQELVERGLVARDAAE